jgi:prephenate dehydratase
VDARPVDSWRDVFDALAAGRAEAGVLPIESLVHGTVREVYDLLLEYEAWIAGEVIVPVRLCLAALPGQSLDDIERVYSHVQALAQAEAFLRSRPWTLLASTTTADAGRSIGERGERGAAAVLSPRAAALHGLEPIAGDIQSDPRNRTRFLVVAARGPAAPAASPAREPARTTLAMWVRNEPGSLHRALGVFARHGVNLSKLESRPDRDRAWDYVFWVDLDGDLCAGPQATALEELRREAQTVRVMGCYQRATEPD